MSARQGGVFEYTATVERVKRLVNSASGNPRFLIYFTDAGAARTAVDAAVAYEITESLRGPVMIRARANGDIFDITPVSV
jgi:hypothetical protein